MIKRILTWAAVATLIGPPMAWLVCLIFDIGTGGQQASLRAIWTIAWGLLFVTTGWRYAQTPHRWRR